MNISDVRTPKQLLSWMRGNLKYNLDLDTVNPPKEVIKTRVGSCIEQSYLEREILRGLGYKPILVYAKENSSSDDYDYSGSGHVFVVYEDGEHWVWFENSMEHASGIHRYDTLEDLFYGVASEWWRYEDSSDLLEFRTFPYPLFNITNEQLAKLLHRRPIVATLDISNNPLESDIPVT